MLSVKLITYLLRFIEIYQLSETQHQEPNKQSHTQQHLPLPNFK